MSDINGMPYFEVAFAADGSPNATLGGTGGLPEAVAGGGVTDAFVLSHGWNNGVDSARQLYRSMFSLLADQLGDRRSSCAAVGVLWPSLLFPDDDPATAGESAASGAQIAAALAPAFPDQQDQLAAMGQLLDERPQQSAKLREFQSLATSLVTTAPQGPEDAGEAELIDSPAAEAFGHASTLAPAPDGDAQGLLDRFSGLWRSARELMRVASYYEMKNRAGVVGQSGLGPLLASLRGPDGTAPRIHLAGHSFGARLVSYSLTGLPASATGPASPIKSLTLIQGAFSHFAFADSLPFDRARKGGLAGMSARVDGPLLSTFSAADRAVGWWYPTASFAARQDAQDADDAEFRWGAVGHDGYQVTPAAEVIALKPAGQPYNFANGRFYALDGNAVIADVSQSKFSGAHSDICHPEVLWALAAAASVPARV